MVQDGWVIAERYAPGITPVMPLIGWSMTKSLTHALIGIAVGNLINVLLPDTVVLGGGLVEAMPDLFVNPVRESANQRVMPAFVDSFDVVAAKLGDDAAIMGAAAWIQHLETAKDAA